MTLLFCGYLINPFELIEKELEDGKAFFNQSIEENKNTFIGQLDETIKKIAKQGDLDLVQKLIKEKKEYEIDKKLPNSKEFKTNLVEFKSNNEKAIEKYKKVLEKNIKEYTKHLEIDKASRLKLELENLIPQVPLKTENKNIQAKKQPFSVFGLRALKFTNLETDNYFYNQPDKNKITLLRNKNDSGVIEKQFYFYVVPGLADKKSVSFASPIEKNHFLVLIEDTVWRLQMEPLKNNQAFIDKATFVLRKTSDPDKFQIESYAKAKQFLVPGSPKMIRFRKDDGSENLKETTNITFEIPVGAK